MSSPQTPTIVFGVETTVPLKEPESDSSVIIWGLIFLLCSAVAAVAILYYYTKETSKMFPIPTYISLFLSVFVCVIPFPLLALDMNAALAAKSAGLSSNPESPWFGPVWYMIFMTTQVTAWLLLPISQGYVLSGEFTVKKRLKASLMSNLVTYAILGVVGAALLGYMIVLKGLRSVSDVVALCLACSNAFGLIVLVIFLASGLVAIPKMLWRMGDAQSVLNNYYKEACQLFDPLQDAVTDFWVIKEEITKLNARISDENRPYYDIMLEEVANVEAKLREGFPMTTRPYDKNGHAAATGEDADHAHLVDLNARLKALTKVVTRTKYMWSVAIFKCAKYDDVVNGRSGGHAGRLTLLFWKTFATPLFLIASLCTWALSLMILWSELILPFRAMTSSPLGLIELTIDSPIHFVGTTVFLFYMAVTSYWANFQLKINDTYHIVPGNSDPVSMCFNATFLTRLIMPLCYNFLWMGNITDKSDLVTYAELFGRMNVVAILGDWFNRFIPLFIPIIALLIESKILNKILTSIGVEEKFSIHDLQNTDDAVIRNARDEVDRAIRDLRGGEGGPVSISGVRRNGAGGENNGIGGGASSVTPRFSVIAGREMGVRSGASSTAGSAVTPQRGALYEEYKARRAAEAAKARGESIV